MAKNLQRRGDDRMLEAGSGGGGGGGGASISGSRWSSLPSFKGKTNLIDDLKKMASDSSHLKGAAKAAKDEAAMRATSRTMARAAGATAAGAGVKTALPSKEEPAEEDTPSVDVNPDVPGGLSGKGMKKGGAAKKVVKGWGKARGARKAKVY